MESSFIPFLKEEEKQNTNNKKKKKNQQSHFSHSPRKENLQNSLQQTLADNSKSLTHQ